MQFFSDGNDSFGFVFLVFEKIFGETFLSAILMKPLDDSVHFLLADSRCGLGVMSLAGLGVSLIKLKAHFGQNTPLFL